MAETKGIDISRHQGFVNWEQIHRSYNDGELGFVIMRAGYGGGKDDQFIRNRDEARVRGIPRGFYFYAYPGRSSGATQAQEFFDRVGPLQPGEVIVLDIEDDPFWGRNLVPADVQWSLEFLTRARELFGVKPLIYMNSDLLRRYDWAPVKNADYGLWLANYGKNDGQPGERPGSGIWPFWAIWQYTSRANLGGINKVDANIFAGDKSQFLRYGLQGAAPTPPPPNPPIPPIAPTPNRSHLVRSGDTLGKIAAAYGTTVDALLGANRGRYPKMTRDYIQTGWSLSIPGGPAPAPRPGAEPVYITVPSGSGGYLGNLSKKYGSSIDQIVAWNKAKYPKISRDYVQAGWVIRVK